MSLNSVLSARVRGFRVVNVLGLTLMLVIAVGSYAFKTLAGAEDAGTASVEDQIAQEQKRIRMLNLEIAALSAAPRVEGLSRQYLGLAPVDPRHEIAAGALAQIAADPRVQAPSVAAPAAPAPGVPAKPQGAD